MIEVQAEGRRGVRGVGDESLQGRQWSTLFETNFSSINRLQTQLLKALQIWKYLNC